MTKIRAVEPEGKGTVPVPVRTRGREEERYVRELAELLAAADSLRGFDPFSGAGRQGVEESIADVWSRAAALIEAWGGERVAISLLILIHANIRDAIGHTPERTAFLIVQEGVELADQLFGGNTPAQPWLALALAWPQFVPPVPDDSGEALDLVTSLVIVTLVGGIELDGAGSKREVNASTPFRVQRRRRRTQTSRAVRKRGGRT